MNGRDIRICTIFAFAKMEFMEKLHPIMFAGTGSDVGKSIIAAAFCRIFKQDGYQPAPFKAQNMALNSFATPEGLEIGRAQAVQAEAAGVPCHTDMNPLLLKPQSDHTSQVVLNGRPIGNRNAYDYFRKEGRDELRWEVCAAYDRLAARYNPVVLEGAGSISEINLRDTDLVNLPMALHAGADVILVGDIDRGGVFASVYGSLMLLRPHERERIKGILINKFRGDIRLFESGITMLEELCGIPVVGVVPYYRDIYIEEEDSVALAAKSVRAEKGKVNIAVILLRHLSNFTDFNVLERDPRVHLFYTNNTDELAKADIILEFFLLVLFHQLAGVLQTSNRHLVRLLGTNQGDVGVFLHLLTINKEEYDKQDSRYDIAKIIHKGTEEYTITSLDKGEAFRL